MSKIDCYSWAEISKICEQLVKKINEPFDVIVCVLRGGAIPGVIIANELGIDEVLGIKVAQKGQITGTGKGAGSYKAEEAVVQIPLNEFPLEGKRILIVDDVLDSGESLKTVVNLIEKRNPENVKVAVMQVKTYSEFKPDYFVEEKENWLFYPWMSKKELEEMREKMANK